MRRYFASFSSGKLKDELKFRSKDYFRNIASEFNQMVQAIQGRQSKEDELISTAIQKLETSLGGVTGATKDGLQAALSSLRQIQEERATPATVEADAQPVPVETTTVKDTV